jgi:hypothetical protein
MVTQVVVSVWMHEHVPAPWFSASQPTTYEKLAAGMANW